MSREVIDAVKTIKSIHDGDYSSLCDKSFVVCDNKKKKRRGKPVKKPKKNKYTLNQLGMTVDKLGMTVDKLGTTVDKLGMTLAKLAKEMRDGFERIEARLDYNNLKKLPESK